jgi:hypothetical protein
MRRKATYAQPYLKRRCSARAASLSLLLVLLGGTALLTWQELAFSTGRGPRPSGSLLWENPAAAFMKLTFSAPTNGSFGPTKLRQGYLYGRTT